MNIINEVVDENGRPPYTQKKYNYKTRHSIITDVYNEVIRLRTEIAKLSKQIRYTQNPQEREELIAKRQELYKLRNRAVAKVWNLSNERTMTQGAKDRAAIKRKENKAKATNINTTIESKTMNKKVIRLTESDLHKIVKESVNRILKEDMFGSEPPYYWSISELRNNGAHLGEWESYQCVEDSATSDDSSKSEFETPDDAYSDGIEQLKYYDKGHYCLEVYYFTSNGAGEYVSGYYAEIHNGKLIEY